MKCPQGISPVRAGGDRAINMPPTSVTTAPIGSQYLRSRRSPKKTAKTAQAMHEQIGSRKRPDLNSILASKYHAWAEPCRSSRCHKIRCHNDPLSPTGLVLREGVLHAEHFTHPTGLTYETAKFFIECALIRQLDESFSLLSAHQPHARGDSALPPPHGQDRERPLPQQ